jgi:hypothetical protein
MAHEINFLPSRLPFVYLIIYLFYIHIFLKWLLYLLTDQATKQAAMVPIAANKNLGAEMHRLPPYSHGTMFINLLNHRLNTQCWVQISGIFYRWEAEI